jgi:hypothetical protein
MLRTSTSRKKSNVLWIGLMVVLPALLTACATSTVQQQYGCPPLRKTAKRLGGAVVIGEILARLYSLSSPSAHPPWFGGVYDVKLDTAVESSIGTVPGRFKVFVRSYYDADSGEGFQPVLSVDGLVGAPSLAPNSTSLLILDKVSQEVQTPDAHYEVMHAELCRSAGPKENAF